MSIIPNIMEVGTTLQKAYSNQDEQNQRSKPYACIDNSSQYLTFNMVWLFAMVSPSLQLLATNLSFLSEFYLFYLKASRARGINSFQNSEWFLTKLNRKFDYLPHNSSSTQKRIYYIALLANFVPSNYLQGHYTRGVVASTNFTTVQSTTHQV